LTEIIKGLKRNKAPNELLESLSKIRNLKAERVPEAQIIKEASIIKSKHTIECLINVLLEKDEIPETIPDFTWNELKKVYYNLIPFMKNPISFEEYTFHMTILFVEAFHETIRRLKEK
jgi:hypothetical protein